MRYIKIIISSVLAMLLAMVVIWVGLFVVIFSFITAPLLALWTSKKNHPINPVVNPVDIGTAHSSYKVVEAEYKIIEK